MKNEKIKIKKLTKSCDNILKLCREYSYLWDNKLIEGNYLGLYSGFIARDETFHIGIEKLNDSEKFVFTGKNFDYGKKGLTGRYAAEELRNYNINADNLLSRFFNSLEKPLGKYLAKKEIQRLKQESKLADLTA